jgi:hypothetical protein
MTPHTSSGKIQRVVAVSAPSVEFQADGCYTKNTVTRFSKRGYLIDILYCIFSKDSIEEKEYEREKA